MNIICHFLLPYDYLHLIVQIVGRASRAECSSGVKCSSVIASAEHRTASRILELQVK